jgi:hypothetical protein
VAEHVRVQADRTRQLLLRVTGPATSRPDGIAEADQVMHGEITPSPASGAHALGGRILGANRAEVAGGTAAA